jgi:flavodoxin
MKVLIVYYSMYGHINRMAEPTDGTTLYPNDALRGRTKQR